MLSLESQEGFHEFANEHFPAFENYGVQFAPQQSIFPGPPTPPGQQMPLAAAHAGQQQPPQPQQHAPVTSVPAAAPLASTSAMVIDQDILPITKPDPGMIDDIQQQQDQSRRGGSNSDDDEMTPAQSRRKAQNRAAYVYVFSSLRLDTTQFQARRIVYVDTDANVYRNQTTRVP